MTRIVRRAPAKLNLTLQVVGRRADGYHLLDSLVAFTEYGDTVAAEPAPRLELVRDGPFAGRIDGPDERNLVLRAARALADWAGMAPAARLTLTKRLPVASGIGGGSSDAAATLLALAALWRLDPTPEQLAAIGLGLGADLPVCLAGRPTRLRGIGEILTPAPDLPAAPVVLVNPGIGLATPPVFKARRGPFSAGPGEPGALAATPPDAAALAAALARHGNDLTPPATLLMPAIADILAALGSEPNCLLARMSGSGATCFALFPTDSDAAAAAASLARTRPEWWSVATRLAPASTA
jgi:4-diphosphocytidyl-2-C-methyl-D-erythritol kinase